ncbi:MAG: CBS domain-containing protein [Planctomycetota bacterium]
MKTANVPGMSKHRVHEVMSRDVVCVDVADTIHDALALMSENRVSALPVVDHQNHCIGILSTADLIDMTLDVDDDLYQLDLIDPTSRRFLVDKLAHSLGNESVSAYMTEVVTTIRPTTTLADATGELLRNRIHHLPVVDEKGHLLGIVSTMDILAESAAEVSVD